MPGPQPNVCRGVSLIDAVISITVLGLTMMGFLGVATSTKALHQETREVETGARMATQLIEQMRSTSLQQVVAMYNADPQDDPEGTGTAPSMVFDQDTYLEAVQGRISTPYDDQVLRLKNAQFRVTLPINPSGEVREDLNLPALGLPRDLNGDGDIDQDDQRTSINRLPVAVRVSWTSPRGPRTIEVQTVLGQ